MGTNDHATSGHLQTFLLLFNFRHIGFCVAQSPKIVNLSQTSHEHDLTIHMRVAGWGIEPHFEYAQRSQCERRNDKLTGSENLFEKRPNTR